MSAGQDVVSEDGKKKPFRKARGIREKRRPQDDEGGVPPQKINKRTKTIPLRTRIITNMKDKRKTA